MAGVLLHDSDRVNQDSSLEQERRSHTERAQVSLCIVTQCDNQPPASETRDVHGPGPEAEIGA